MDKPFWRPLSYSTQCSVCSSQPGEHEPAGLPGGRETARSSLSNRAARGALRAWCGGCRWHQTHEAAGTEANSAEARTGARTGGGLHAPRTQATAALCLPPRDPFSPSLCRATPVTGEGQENTLLRCSHNRQPWLGHRGLLCFVCGLFLAQVPLPGMLSHQSHAEPAVS